MFLRLDPADGLQLQFVMNYCDLKGTEANLLKSVIKCVFLYVMSS